MSNSSQLQEKIVEATNKLQLYLKRLSRFTDVEEVKCTLRDLCNDGADLDYLEKERGFSCIPCVYWNMELMELLMERGRDINSKDDNGDTVLNIVLRNYYEPPNYYDPNKEDKLKNIVQFLLDHSADPNIPNLRGETALFILTREIKKPEKLVEMLVARGADLKTRTNAGESLLHLESNDYLLERLYLTYKGENVDFRTSKWLYSKTPLMLACQRGDLEYCKWLIQLGSDINAQDLQGYNALHHALMGGFNDRNNSCAEYLIEIGADIQAKSTSGKEIYEFALAALHSEYPHRKCFTYGAEPAKQVKIFEMAGAKEIMRNINKLRWNKKHIRNLWDKGMEVCEKFGIQPSKEFSTNLDFLKRNLDTENSKSQMYVAAMDTIARLSEGEKSKFWNLLAFSPTSDLYSDRNNPFYVFETLNYLSTEFDRVGDFASVEEKDFKTLASLAKFFEEFLDRLFRLNYDRNSEKTLLEKGISHLHSIVNMTIACFEKRILETESRKVLTGDYKYLYKQNIISLSHHIRHTRFRDVISEEMLIRNERLLRSLIDIDPLDQDENNLLHLALSGWFYYNVMDAPLDSGFVVISAKNVNEFIARIIRFPKCMENHTLLVKMADKGAHLDAKNDFGNPTLKDMLEKYRKYSSFAYDSLQCICARVLVQSLVPYRNRVPKRMVDFILMH